MVGFVNIPFDHPSPYNLRLRRRPLLVLCRVFWILYVLQMVGMKAGPRCLGLLSRIRNILMKRYKINMFNKDIFFQRY